MSTTRHAVAVAVAVAAVAGCAPSRTSALTALSDDGSGDVLHYSAVLPLGAQLHRLAPRLRLRSGAGPVQLRGLTYVDLPHGLESEPAVCYRYSDTHAGDSLGWVGDHPKSELIGPSHPAAAVTVDSTGDPTQWCALTVVARRAGNYSLSHIRIDYENASGSHTQDFNTLELDFHAG